MTLPEEIYEFVAEHGTPCRLPGLWGRFKGHPAFFHPERDSEALLESLRAEFGCDDLVNAGVVVTSEQNVAVLNPALAGEGAVVAALRKSGNGKPFCLLSRGGCIARRHWPFRAVLEDHRTRTFRKKMGNQLLIAASPADVAILWSMGFPAAPATGLGAFARQQIDEFCSALGLPRHPIGQVPESTYSITNGNSEKGPILLVLVGWSPEQLDVQEPAKIKNVQAHLRKLHINLGIPLDDVVIWTPSAADLARLRFCLDEGVARDVKRALIDSLEHSYVPLIEAPMASKESQPTHADLRAEWIALQSRNTDRASLRRVWDRLQECQERELIEPLVRQAQKSDDPAYQTLNMALAGISRIMHPQAILMATNYANAVRSSGGKSTVLLPPEELKQLLAMADRMRSISHELQSYAARNDS